MYIIFLDFRINSVIITDNASYKTRLRHFLSPAVGSKTRRVFCYRASTHGWASRTFHSRCDGKRDTITIIKNGEYVFGGYTDIPWGNWDKDKEPLLIYNNWFIIIYWVIITDNASYKTRLRHFLSPAVGSKTRRVFCYRASHGWAHTAGQAVPFTADVMGWIDGWIEIHRTYLLKFIFKIY